MLGRDACSSVGVRRSKSRRYAYKALTHEDALDLSWSEDKGPLLDFPEIFTHFYRL